jgi:hypothetical protein
VNPDLALANVLVAGAAAGQQKIEALMHGARGPRRDQRLEQRDARI